MSEEEIRHERYEERADILRRPHFEGTITLGHILTAMMMGGAMVTMFVNFRVTEADHEARLKALEASTVEIRSTNKTLAENQATNIHNLDRLTMLFEQMNNAPRKQP